VLEPEPSNGPAEEYSARDRCASRFAYGAAPNQAADVTTAFDV